MTTRFLITTPDEATWKTDQPVLFLGEWCRLYSRRHVWSALDAQVVPYHWDDRAKFFNDYLYLRELHERLLATLAARLNEIHGVAHGIRYWRILIGPWLGYFTQMVFDRWECVQRAVNHYALDGTAVLVGHERALVPNDMTAFTGLYYGDAWNHYLFAEILRGYTQVPFVEVPRTVPPRGAAHTRTSTVTKLKLSVANAAMRFLRTFSRERDVFFMGTYLPARQEIALQRTFGQVPLLWLNVAATQVPVDPARREWVLDGACASPFESCLWKLIPRQLPVAYLEGYEALGSQVDALPWPKHPRLIWTSNAHTLDDVFKAWAAAKVEAGAPLVIGQHGGFYGIGKWGFLEDHDMAICDRYLSWGWSDRASVQPVGQLKQRRPLGVEHAAQPAALLVMCAMPRYPYWMYSAIVGRQFLDYFEDQCAFVSGLPEHIQDALIVRLFMGDYGWGQEGRWRERFPNLRLDAAAAPIDERVRGSRLYISTYNGTTFLESFTMDVPAVVFWNPAHWELRDSALEDFDALERVGIFHRTPQSAARHVAAIWDDVGAWWSSVPVRTALARFKSRYCDLPADLPRRVEQALRGVLAEQKQAVAE